MTPWRVLADRVIKGGLKNTHLLHKSQSLKTELLKLIKNWHRWQLKLCRPQIRNFRFFVSREVYNIARPVPSHDAKISTTASTKSRGLKAKPWRTSLETLKYLIIKPAFLNLLSALLQCNCSDPFHDYWAKIEKKSQVIVLTNVHFNESKY